MVANKKKPAIRFEGFEEEWQEKQLGEIGDFKNGMNFGKEAMGNGFPFVNLENVFGKNIVDSSNLGFAESSENQRKDYNLTKGDILFIRSSVKPEGVGEAAVIINNLNNTTFSGFIIRFRPTINLDINFNRFVFSIGSSRKQILSNATSSANTNINQNSLQKLKVSLPIAEEQTQIGNYFKALDGLIQLQEQKLEKVTNLKKAMLKKMFPAANADVPEIRFKGFREKWEKKELLKYISKIVDFRGRTPKKLGFNWSNEGYLALSALNVRSGFIDKSIDAHYGNEKMYNIWMSGNELHKGQVIFTTEAPMGNVAQIPDDEKYILSQRTIAFEVEVNLMVEDFLSVLLSTPKSFERLTALSSGGTAKGISQKSLARFKVMAPKNLKEQQKIGEYFKNLDQLINHSHQTTFL